MIRVGRYKVDASGLVIIAGQSILFGSLIIAATVEALNGALPLFVPIGLLGVLVMLTGLGIACTFEAQDND